MNNFKCTHCSHEFFITRFTQKSDGTYFHKNQQIKCPSCDSTSIEYIVKEGDFSKVSLGKYSMKSLNERQEMLKKRSREHFLKHEIDKKYQIDKNPTLQRLND